MTEPNCGICNKLIIGVAEMAYAANHTFHVNCLPKNTRGPASETSSENFPLLVQPLKFYSDAERKHEVGQNGFFFFERELRPGEKVEQTCYCEFSPPSPELLGIPHGLLVFRDARLVAFNPPNVMKAGDWLPFSIVWTGRTKPAEAFLIAEWILPYDLVAPARMKIPREVMAEKVQQARKDLELTEPEVQKYINLLERRAE